MRAIVFAVLAVAVLVLVSADADAVTLTWRKWNKCHGCNCGNRSTSWLFGASKISVADSKCLSGIDANGKKTYVRIWCKNATHYSGISYSSAGCTDTGSAFTDTQGKCRNGHSSLTSSTLTCSAGALTSAFIVLVGVVSMMLL